MLERGHGVSAQSGERHRHLSADVGWEQPSDRAVFAERVRDYALATLFKAQLRRRRDPRQEGADGAVCLAGPFARGGVDGDDPLPRMARQPRDARLEERTGRDGLVVRPVVAEPREHVPEVRRDHGKPRKERGLLQRVRREAAPSPLVLHLVEDVLAVPAFAVEGQDVPRVHVEVRDERVPLVAVGVVFAPGLHQLEAGDVQLR